MRLAGRRPPTAEEYVAYRETFCNRGHWGDDDQFGTLNFSTEETHKTAAAPVREGRAVSCGRYQRRHPAGD